MAISPGYLEIFHRILGREYSPAGDYEGCSTLENTYMRPEQMSTFIAKATGQILSYEQIQRLSQHTEGWLPALSWVAEFLQREKNLPPWTLEDLNRYLLEKSTEYFHKKLQYNEPLPYLKELHTLSLIPSEINVPLLQALFEKESIPKLVEAIDHTPWLIKTSPTTWRIQPLLKSFLQNTAQEQLPDYKNSYRQIIQAFIDLDNPLAADAMLERLPSAGDPLWATILFNLGEALAGHGHKEKALASFGRASLCYGQMNDSGGITRSLNAMGTLYLECGRLDEAEVLYQQMKQEFPPDRWKETFIPAFLSRSVPKLRILCFGEFEVHRRDEPLDWKKWKRRKALSILQYLILQPSHRAAKEELLDLFWPEESPEKASNAYHVTIHALRQALSSGPEEKFYYLGVERGAVYLLPELISFIDVEEFRKAIQEGHQLWATNPSSAVQWFQTAKKLYRGSLLEGIRYEEWLIPYQESLHSQYLEILTHLAHYYTQQQDETTALSIFKELLQQDPSNEYAVREAMLLLHRLNRRTEALTLYKKLLKLLKDELNTLPEPQTESLYQNLLKNVRRD